MRLLVCGSRDWSDRKIMNVVLNGFANTYDDLMIIHGAAPGADSLSGLWAKKNGLEVEEYPADWGKHGKAAGPLRNQQMLDEGGPDMVVAFKDGFDWDCKRGGTEDMIRRTRENKIPYFVVGT